MRTRPGVLRMIIPAMSTVHATRAVWTSLGGIPGVTRAQVSRGVAVVEHDGSATVAALTAAVELAGFTVERWEHVRPSLPIVDR